MDTVAATRLLAKRDPQLGAWVKKIGPCEIKSKRGQELYQSLVEAIAHQQLHGKAAATILGRLRELEDGEVPSAKNLLQMPESQLRACGFSMAKIAALKDIAQHQISGIIPTLAQARSLSDAVLIERLTAIRGVGRWTVEMLLIFQLKRPDIWPVDDFGIRNGFRILRALPEMPTPRALRDQGDLWRPWRSIASWYLWRIADLSKD
jgi:DNA-3-methyladenine glycosylase II